MEYTLLIDCFWARDYYGLMFKVAKRFLKWVNPYSFLKESKGEISLVYES